MSSSDNSFIFSPDGTVYSRLTYLPASSYSRSARHMPSHSSSSFTSSSSFFLYSSYAPLPHVFIYSAAMQRPPNGLPPVSAQPRQSSLVGQTVQSAPHIALICFPPRPYARQAAGTVSLCPHRRKLFSQVRLSRSAHPNSAPI